MLDKIVIKENWLTKAPAPRAVLIALLIVAVVCATSLMYLADTLAAHSWMPASRTDVFTHHEYWRAWTALLIHADPLHLLSNLLLFAPLAFWLVGYFGVILFPLAGFAVGGLVNLLVLLTMPTNTYLLGVSGVVYWMGAVWLTLYLLIDRRHSLKRRATTAIGLVIMLLVPETYTPDVSYMSHLLGFLAGVPCALLYYYIYRSKFHAAEVREYIYTDDDVDEQVDASATLH